MSAGSDADCAPSTTPNATAANAVTVLARIICLLGCRGADLAMLLDRGKPLDQFPRHFTQRREALRDAESESSPSSARRSSALRNRELPAAAQRRRPGLH